MFVNWKKKYEELRDSVYHEKEHICRKIAVHLQDPFYMQDVDNLVDRLIKKHKKPEVSDTERRLKMLECEEHDWVYETSSLSYTGVLKRCACGKEVGMDYKDWIQEQADMHYKKHCEFTERLNKEEK